ncbi:hypothetical protein BKA00_007456 [Actinomadura coerulea]|uniref:Uncharacterized protein n=1 Tax=Actinomadura coerulea TaxID=46159 RepID=A0A7X0G6V6_9ACTN|nr:hypothetical protein [Actinomadura coerulea]MBB6400542.1 hypothetical protein [Actinomadura coerulea]GGQ07991.1 hypothetical protein GCM10010187_25110 [Actinomadura coerulea]
MSNNDTRTPITLDVLDADGYDDEAAYLAGFDAMDERDALTFARGREIA